MSRGKAARMVYEKAASLCVAAGYTHLEILQQESEAIQQDDTANASLRVRFFLEDGDDRIDCGRKASDRYVGQAAAKLQENGYRNPSVEATAETGSSRPGVGR